MYTLVTKQWHSIFADIVVGVQGTDPEVVTLDSLGVTLGKTVVELKEALEGFAEDVEPATKPLAKQWYNLETDAGYKDCCTLADAWRLLGYYYV